MKRERKVSNKALDRKPGERVKLWNGETVTIGADGSLVRSIVKHMEKNSGTRKKSRWM
jgi:hypothetical protein